MTSISTRNDIAHEDIQDIKSDILSLDAKILAIKVSSIKGRFPITLRHGGRFNRLTIYLRKIEMVSKLLVQHAKSITTLALGKMEHFRFVQIDQGN